MRPSVIFGHFPFIQESLIFSACLLVSSLLQSCSLGVKPVLLHLRWCFFLCPKLVGGIGRPRLDKRPSRCLLQLTGFRCAACVSVCLSLLSASDVQGICSLCSLFHVTTGRCGLAESMSICAFGVCCANNFLWEWIYLMGNRLLKFTSGNQMTFERRADFLVTATRFTAADRLVAATLLTARARWRRAAMTRLRVGYEGPGGRGAGSTFTCLTDTPVDVPVERGGQGQYPASFPGAPGSPGWNQASLFQFVRMYLAPKIILKNCLLRLIWRGEFMRECKLVKADMWSKKRNACQLLQGL